MPRRCPCHTGDDACAALAEAVHDAPSLKLIDVSNNSLYFPGVSKISTASKAKSVTVESVGNFSTEEMLSALTHGLSFVVALVACIPLLTDAYQADRFTFWRVVRVLRGSRRWRLGGTLSPQRYKHAGAASPTRPRC